MNVDEEREELREVLEGQTLRKRLLDEVAGIEALKGAYFSATDPEHRRRLVQAISAARAGRSLADHVVVALDRVEELRATLNELSAVLVGEDGSYVEAIEKAKRLVSPSEETNPLSVLPRCPNCHAKVNYYENGIDCYKCKQWFCDNCYDTNKPCACEAHKQEP